MSDSVDHRDGQSQDADSIDEVCLITISYKGDFDLAGELCTSIDRFAAPGIEHVLVVPRSDISRFARLEAPNRRVVAVEDVLQNGYYRLPTPSRIDVGRLYRRRIREVWRGPSGLIRGWIVQQIVKLSAPAITERQVIVFADSDIVLVRPLSAGMFVDLASGVRLYRVPGATSDSAMHREWHKASARLLGLPRTDYFGADYIGNLITWRRDVILQLHDQLENVGKDRWDKIIGRERVFSEYILYGIFAEHILDLHMCGHLPTSQDLVHAGWHYSLNTPSGLSDFVSSIRSNHVAVAIQSTEGFTIDQRRQLIRQIVEPRSQG